MLSQQELYAQAMQKISTRRQIARALADEMQEMLETNFPEYAQATHAFRKAGIDLSLAAISGKDMAEAEAVLSAAKKHRDDVLVQLGRAPDCTSPKFACALCEDSGLSNGAICQCVRTLMREIRREEIASTTALSITKFEQMDVAYYPNGVDPTIGQSPRHYMQDMISDLKEYAYDFDRSSSNLLLFGNSGIGKTHAALSIAGVVLEKGYDVIYISSPDFFSTLENYHFNRSPAEERALLEAATEADLLILDDLGTELVSAFVISTLYTLLNNRIAAGAPTIFTSNIIDSTVFEKRYTEKISSRILGACEPFHFIGEDIRTIKAME